MTDETGFCNPRYSHPCETVLVVAEADYRYGAGELRLRVDAVERRNGRDGRDRFWFWFWPPLGGVSLGEVCGLGHDLLFVADVVEDMIQTWAPDDLWAVAQPLIPVAAKRPQGGGRRRADVRAVFAAIAYMVQAGCSWRKLPAAFFGVSRPTVHRRFTEWTRHGLWEQIHHELLHRLQVAGGIDWSRAIVDSISVRALKRGT